MHLGDQVEQDRRFRSKRGDQCDTAREYLAQHRLNKCHRREITKLTAQNPRVTLRGFHDRTIG
jgi:hypothetical protein